MSDGFETRRRDFIASVAGMLALGSVPEAVAQHAHNMVAEEAKLAGVYKPKLLNPHEFATVRRMAEMILPADDVSPSALDAGAPEFIDVIASANADIGSIYTGGLLWLDQQMQKRYGSAFVDAKPDQQTEFLDLIAYRKNDTPELGPGIVFFSWVRRMVVDAFYTSPVGVKDIGYMGNKGMARFQVPVEAINYALNKSGLG